MAKYPAQLQSANLNEFGIVYADEVQGHKTVATLNALYAITDPILSKSVVNTNNDAIGQEWFVVSKGCYYRLDNWANRHTASGWTKIQVVDTEFNSLSTHGADKIKNFTTSPSTVTLNYNTWRSSTVNEDGTAVINAATQTAAGVLSAADKTKVDRITGTNHVISQSTTTATSRVITITGINPTDNKAVSSSITLPEVSETQAGLASASDKKTLNAIKTLGNSSHLKDDDCWTRTAYDVAINFTCTNVSGNSTDTDAKSEHSVNIGAASSTLAGVMTSTDKTELDRITTANFALGAVTPAASSVAIAATKTTISTGASAANNITLPAASSTLAGVMTSTDKTELDRITTANFALGAVTPAASSVAIAATKTTISTGASAANNITLPAATASVAGVMTAADKVKLDTTLPNLINSNKTTIDNYTVNGIKISTNPVVTGANAKVTGYSKPTTTGAIAATDSINGALGKLEKKLDDEVTNRTNAVSNLTNTVNNNKTTIDNYTVNGIKISTNPVVTGANAKVTGYSKPTTTGAIAATDSINGALGKLEKKLDDEVTNRTNAVSNLTNTVNNNKTTIDNYTVGGIKISANPKVANGTNTTVSTANSTITWSLNSTISLTRVNASSGFYQTSDKRLKSDIKPLEHTLEEICSIPTDSFILGGKKDLGTIAQELEPTFPELVTDAELKQSDVPNPENFETIEKDGETYVLVKEVDYAKMSVLAIEGIKLLKAEIDELKKQLLDK